MSELFSVPYFIENLKQHIEMNQSEDKNPRDEQLLPFRCLNTRAGPADEKRSCPETDSAFR
ncbi:YvfG protein [Bacillus subtilis subsp. subtilis]|nr:YvfG protein [Bacillus subtilis subsp. subtilis]